MTNKVFKPTLQNYFKHGAGALRITVGLIFIIAIAVLGYDKPLFWAAPLSVLILVVMLVGFFLRSLTVTESEIIYKGWFGKRVTLTPQQVFEIILASKYEDYTMGEVQRIFIETPGGKLAFSISTAYWPDETVSGLTEWGKTHSIQQVREDEHTNVQLLTAKYGKLIPFHERRLWATAFILVGGFVVLYLIWFFIFQFPSYL